MTVVLVDDRWPTSIPLEIVAQMTLPLGFSEELSSHVRNVFGGIVSVEDSSATGTFVAVDSLHPEVIRRVSAGEQLFEVPSRLDPAFVAARVMEKALQVGQWEKAQTHESLLPYLREESEEFIEAVTSRASDQELCSELGDILLQVLFHAEIACRRGTFDFDDVALSFIEKMRSRAPYLFDGTVEVVPVEKQEELWAKGKQCERE